MKDISIQDIKDAMPRIAAWAEHKNIRALYGASGYRMWVNDREIGTDPNLVTGLLVYAYWELLGTDPMYPQREDFWEEVVMAMNGVERAILGGRHPGWSLTRIGPMFILRHRDETVGASDNALLGLVLNCRTLATHPFQTIMSEN